MNFQDTQWKRGLCQNGEFATQYNYGVFEDNKMI